MPVVRPRPRAAGGAEVEAVRPVGVLVLVRTGRSGTVRALVRPLVRTLVGAPVRRAVLVRGTALVRCAALVRGAVPVRRGEAGRVGGGGPDAPVGPGAEPRAQPGAQLGAVGQAGQGVVGGPVGELELVPLALLDVLDVGEQEAGPVGGVGDHGVPQGHPDVRAVPAGEAQLGASALGRGPQQRAHVLGVDQVGEGVPPHHGGGPPEQPAQGVVGPEQPPVLVAAHLRDGHPGRGVLERLAERLLAGPERLLLPLQPDEGPLHVGAQPGVADGDGRLGGVHLERLAAPGAGAAAVAGPVDGDDAEQFALAARGVHGGVEPVEGVPLVLEAGLRAVRVPLGHVVVDEDPALGVRYEPQVAPGLAHAEAPVPGGAGADTAGDQGLRGGVPGEGGDDEVAVRADEVDAGQLVAEAGEDAVGDGLQRVGQAAGRVEVGDDLVQLPQGRKTDVRLRLGLHCSLSPRPRQQQLQMCQRRPRAVSPATESQGAVPPVHRVNKYCPL